MGGKKKYINIFRSFTEPFNSFIKPVLSSMFIYFLFPSELWRCWLGDRKGMWHVKSWVLVCWWWQFDWSFARLTAPVVSTTSVFLSSNNIQNGDILVPANPGAPGKWALKQWEMFICFLSVVLVLLSVPVPVQVTDWKDSPSEWLAICWIADGLFNLLLHLICQDATYDGQPATSYLWKYCSARLEL